MTGAAHVAGFTNAIGRRYWVLPIAAALLAAVVFHLSAPQYLRFQGFPLDDSWIHAVYARELAHSGMLAYNPGVPATGETSPLWAIVLAPLYVAASPPLAILLTKVLGFALHVASALLFGRALARLTPARPWVAWSGAALVAAHPDLVAASVSGMEVPLATLMIAAALLAVSSGTAALILLAAAAATAARPETAVVVAAAAFFFWLPEGVLRACLSAGAALAGAVASLALVGVRNWGITGRPLPATFYVKANTGSPFNSALQQLGFADLLGHIPLLNVTLAVFALAIVSAVLVRRRDAPREAHAAAALFLAGVVFCAVSFALVPPLDPPAFYHQRYVLPAVAPMVAAMPLLVDAILSQFVRRPVAWVVPVAVMVLGLVLMLAVPARAIHLSNDARNIDDVQVAFGRALADAPAESNAWVVDAGASRFFGRAFVVDTIGLNTPELIGADAQHFLDRHPPAYLDVFPGWSALRGDPAIKLPARVFEATTKYTVTSADSMRTHVLVTCTPPGYQGAFVVRGRLWTFRCSS